MVFAEVHFLNQYEPDIKTKKLFDKGDDEGCISVDEGGLE
jgi:peptide deformylase